MKIGTRKKNFEPHQVNPLRYTTKMNTVSAKYCSPTTNKIFTADSNNPRYQTTNGKTTGPSDYVLNAGQIDRDKPSDPKQDINNPGNLTLLSNTRMQLTGIQDDINEFLTEQMEIAKNKRVKRDELKVDK